MSAAVRPQANRVKQTPMTQPQRIFLGLLVVSISLNYIDRGSLAVAGKMITDELRLNPEQLGRLFSAFFWTYALLQIPAGWLVDRYNVNRVYAIGFFIWSLAMVLTGFASGFAALMAARLLLGMGECVAYPSYSRILAANFKEHQRGLANCLIDAGCKAGPALGILIGGTIMAKSGWRAFFMIVGAASMLWIIPWSIWSPRKEAAQSRSQGSAPRISQILRNRSAWGTFIGLLCSNYTWYFMAFWVPVYFREERHFTESDLARIGQIPFWGIVCGTLLGGWLSDRLIARGKTPTVVRKSFACVGLALCTVMIFAPQAREIDTALAWLTLSGFAFGLFSSNVWAITQTLAGPSAAGKWTGIQNFLANTPGMFGLWFTGWLIQYCGGRYLPAFYVAGAFSLVGVAAYIFIVERVQEVDWTKESFAR